MMQVLTSAAMKAADEYTIKEIGVPSAVLMERASYACARAVRELSGDGMRDGRVLVLSGSGNNGGDGLACARILTLMGVPCEVLFAGNPDHMTEETTRQYGIAERLGIPIITEAEKYDFRSCSVIVDALFGIGLARDVSGKYADLIREVNASGRPVLAVDIPSGVDADTGRICGCAVRAAVTVTMERPKPGLFLYPGAAFAGKILTEEIGVLVRGDAAPVIRALEKGDLPRLLPVRDASGNKGTFGKILIAAGSRGMAGAAYLAARAALGAGAGMVKILTPACNRPVLQTLLPEALISAYDSPEEALSEFAKGEEWADVLAAGPGLGQGPEAEALVRAVLTLTEKPLVLDADGLNLAASMLPLLKNRRGDMIITPHVGEMSRLTGTSIPEIKSGLISAAVRFSAEYGTVTVLKDARTVTALPDGSVFINASGNDGMATAGSGDVLTGIASSLAAQGLPCGRAAPLAVFLHGMAGDLAAEEKGKRGMTAGDLAEAVPAVLREYDN